jgi:unsaturated rhamnogalacturonyl hydrolase
MPTRDRVKQALLSMQRYPWEQGVAAQAFLELGDLETATRLAQAAVQRQAADGRLAQIGPAETVTDPAACGEAVLVASRLSGDPELHEGTRKMLDYLMHAAPRAEDGTLYHLVDQPQVWIDSLYMGPPFLAVVGHPEEAVRQIDGITRRLWMADKRLFAAIWDEARGLVRAEAWGVGNGWAAAGLARVIAALSEGPDRGRLAALVTELLDGCLAHQRADGLFHNVADDPSTFVETNLAQMLAYTIYRGLGDGWLSTAYRPAADRMRAAAHAKVDADGWVRDVCGAPTFDRPGIAAEGQAFFLLMEAAFARMTPD